MYVYTTEYINAHYIFHNFPGLIVGEDEILVPPELTGEEILRALGNVRAPYRCWYIGALE